MHLKARIISTVVLLLTACTQEERRESSPLDTGQPTQKLFGEPRSGQPAVLTYTMFENFAADPRDPGTQPEVDRNSPVAVVRRTASQSTLSQANGEPPQGAQPAASQVTETPEETYLRERRIAKRFVSHLRAEKTLPLEPVRARLENTTYLERFAELGTRRPHRTHLTSIAFSPTTDEFLVGGLGTISRWQGDGGKMTTWRTHTRNVTDNANDNVTEISPVDRLIVAGDSNGRLSGLDLGEKVTTAWKAHNGPILSLSRPEDREFVSAGGDGVVHRWRLLTPDERREKKARVEERGTWKSHGSITSLAVRGDGQRALWGTRDGTVGLRELERTNSGDGDLIIAGDVLSRGSLDSDSVAGISKLEFSGNGRRGMSLDLGQRFVLWDLEEKSASRHWSMPAKTEEKADKNGEDGRPPAVTAIALNSEGIRAVAGDDQGAVYFWDLTHPGQDPIPVRHLGSHGTSISAVMFSADDRWLLSGSIDHDVRLWDVGDLRRMEMKRRLSVGHLSRVTSLGIDPQKKWLVSGGRDRTLKLWDMASEKEIWSQPMSGAVTDLEFRPGYLQFLVVLEQYPEGDESPCPPESPARKRKEPSWHLRLWEIEPRKESLCQIGEFGPYCKRITSVCFSPDGNEMLSGDVEGTLTLWNYLRTAAVRSWSAHEQSVRALSFHPRGGVVVSGGDDGILKRWNLSTARGMGDAQMIGRHRSSVASLAFHPNGRFLLSGSHSGELILWKIGDDHVVDLWRGSHEKAVFHVDFLDGGGRACTLDVDGQVRLWRIESHGERAKLKDIFAARVTKSPVAATMRGDLLAVAKRDTTMMILRCLSSQP